MLTLCQMERRGNYIFSFCVYFLHKFCEYSMKDREEYKSTLSVDHAPVHNPGHDTPTILIHLEGDALNVSRRKRKEQTSVTGLLYTESAFPNRTYITFLTPLPFKTQPFLHSSILYRRQPVGSSRELNTFQSF